MDTKSLKKQLGAAIAMVLVAAVALGSSTYAWFVSNNTVTATSSTISAQSNSAYLVIDTTTTNSSSTSSKSITGVDNKALYPASIEKTATGEASWYSNYAKEVGGAAAKDDDAAKFMIKDTTANSTNAEGSAAAAVAMGYAIKETFHIGTGTYDGTFSGLKVSGVTVKNSASDTAKNLGNAMRVLVVCGQNWQVWSAQGEQLQSGSTGGAAIADSVSKNNDVTVEVYVYYEGSDDNVFSNNLETISKDQNGVTITFTATPTEYGKSSTN